MPTKTGIYRVDKFSVPQAAKDEFLKRVRDTHHVLRRQPGFIRDMLLEQVAGPGQFNIVTIALRLYFETGSTSGIQGKHAAKLRMQLVALNTAMEVSDLDIPGYKLHPLKGDRKSIWSIAVSGNWRLTFEFRDGHAYLLDYEDYH